jgi:ABC-2 type transport system permease protein
VIVAERFTRDRRRALLWWVVSSIGLVLMTLAFFPGIEGKESFDDLVADIPESLRPLVGLEEGISLSSAPGYLQSQLYSTLVPLVLLIFGIGLGARAIGGAEEDGTLELLLANPVTRRRVLGERYAAVIGLVVGLGAAFAVSVLVLGPLFGALEGIGAGRVLAASLAVLCLALLHTTLALAVGAATGHRVPAIAFASGVAVAGYLVHGLLEAAVGASWLQSLSPWHWFLDRNLLVEDVNWFAAVGLPLALSAALVLVGARVFAGRDLH